jgi:hypothetical protein
MVQPRSQDLPQLDVLRGIDHFQGDPVAKVAHHFHTAELGIEGLVDIEGYFS